ncbi:TniB family NTP-binding protein [Sphingomonas donggukensis]|uniref:TniB family NTP-binding protein n=1 Tax=Sphingomonas donggukensis TaxID=2949093 RepID=A0ABY4TRN9_9SPHN|nr:TniB family NTP-binding protein [Sphingomonas donggukensis]URW75060.1 TniB family NTP-binding protein [Sphingomonas donggukensis]
MTEKASERAARIGAARAEFDGIVVDYPPTTAAIETIEELRVATRLRPASTPCGGILLNAPIGTGKTSTVRQAATYAASTAPEGNTPILLVEMPTAGSTDSVPSAILGALGHARPDLGKPAARWLRAVADMRARGVEILVFDEFNRANRRPTMSRPIATSIREHIMDAGVAAVVFVGTADAAVVLDQCPELLDRLEGEIDLSPLEWCDEEDRELFTDFVKDIDQALVDKRLLDEHSGLGKAKVAQRLCEASRGRLRPLMRIVRGAMAIAMKRDGTSISVADLHDATEDYAKRFRMIERNPFA